MYWVKRKKDIVALFIYFLSLLSLILFLYVFIPFEISRKKYIVGESSQSSFEHVRTKSIVLLIIDGLRIDQVQSKEYEEFMPFLSFIKSQSCFLPIRVQPPTVTMPRIKSLTSGIVPSFSDLIINLGTSEFIEDTFIRQAHLHHLTTVFYGDDTWLKMFPNRFTRSEGVHSFFATDFIEVDDNVTRKLELELSFNKKWDLMVLHYLGLDHLGHVEGPRGRNVPQKLREMDDVIKKLIVYLGDRGLVLLTGDHGTKDSGGHGGVTFEEVHVPLIAANISCRQIPGWPDNYTAQQIDLASTISILLHIPIPSGNTGKPIPALLQGFSLGDIFHHLMTVKRSLQQRITPERQQTTGTEALFDAWRKTEDPSAATDLGKRLYRELSDLSDEINRAKAEFNVPVLFFATGLLAALFIITMLIFNIPFPHTPRQFFLAIATVAHSLSLTSSSFIEEEHQTWYFAWATLLVIIFKDVMRSEEKKKWKIILAVVVLCVLHRFLRCLNQTGDKWASMPDLADFLVVHPQLLLTIFFSGIFILWILYIKVSRTTITTLIYGAALICVIFYRLATESSLFPPIFQHYPLSKGRHEVNFFFLFLTILILQKIPFAWIWSLLSVLTLRSHNVILVPVHILVSKLIHNLVNEDEFWSCIIHIWIGRVFYFYQGNSNSFANVDVAAGFIGSQEYNMYYAGFMMAVNTFSAPVLAFFLSPQCYTPVLVTQLLQMTVYCSFLISQRHHLFVWSVFTPKLLLSSALFFIQLLILLSHCVITTIYRVRL